MTSSGPSSGALALLIRGGTDNWSNERWKARFTTACPGRPIVQVPEEGFDAASISYAAVWKPRPGELAGFPNLKVIFNLGAGVDAVLADTQMPNVPLVRVAVDDLTQRMTEYIVMHVLMHHRQQSYLAGCQQHKQWKPTQQWAAGAVRVGLLGLGVLGRDAADVLTRLGFRVAGWSNSPKTMPGIECYAGAAGLRPFLARTDILVCLLPLTPDTRHILNRPLFAQLAKDGPLGGPILINAGRGGLQNEADILSCLEDGTLNAATLDVFETEPLPVTSPLWTHPRVTISPHNAADTDADAISIYVARQIADFERGLPLANVVDRSRGY
ncbi:glyoxylate/hydroxypyruvate reductase A [Bradyrhizobium prioriisuperbiae]|uniref:2-hydroxyacid dehydrogenase n=1 Tax=Bradyrhizobium prioriisuperbiae TaxID=2854389 RepID=UPI0028E7190C|nr:glyoxylate/hydroxypyruvate reductase A [Bradyrhizobium prioritasuperba]